MRNDMDGDEVANAVSCCAAGFGSCLDSADIAADHDGDETAADVDFAAKADVRRFDHGIGCFDGSDEASGFDHS